jgi:hypothetical protein
MIHLRQDLAEELERMRKTMEKQCDLKVAIRRTAGRNHQPIPLQDSRLERRVEIGPREIVKLGGTLQLPGVATMTYMEKQMDYAFRNSQDQRSCLMAFQDMKEFRLFPKSRWKELDKAVRERFKDERLDERPHPQSRGNTPTLDDMIQMMRKSRTRDPSWKQRAKEWVREIRNEQQTLRYRYDEEPWQFGRPRLRDSISLEVEVLSNNPGKIHD